MPKHFHLTTSAASVVVELTRDPKQYDEFMRLLYARRFTGQILVDFHRGLPRQVGFPQVARVRIPPPKP